MWSPRQKKKDILSIIIHFPIFSCNKKISKLLILGGGEGERKEGKKREKRSSCFSREIIKWKVAIMGCWGGVTDNCAQELQLEWNYAFSAESKMTLKEPHWNCDRVPFTLQSEELGVELYDALIALYCVEEQGVALQWTICTLLFLRPLLWLCSPIRRKARGWLRDFYMCRIFCPERSNNSKCKFSAFILRNECGGLSEKCPL